MNKTYFVTFLEKKLKLWYVHPMKYYPAMNRSKPLIHEHLHESQKHHAAWKKPDTNSADHMILFP